MAEPKDPETLEREQKERAKQKGDRELKEEIQRHQEELEKKTKQDQVKKDERDDEYKEEIRKGPRR